MEHLSDIGEFGLIHRFSSNFLSDLPNGIVGIGDDCACIPLNKKEILLVTTDMLIEDRHFLLNKIKPYELGYKSLAVNLSDIAAMGGAPHSAYLSIGIPSGFKIEWLDEFFKGIKDLCESTNTLLLGGDTTGSPDRLVINIAVLGSVKNKHIKKRSMAKPGDIICVTNYLGNSGAGLKILLENIEPENKQLESTLNYLVKSHHMPVPQIKEGEWLSQQKGVNAMMDVSDGISSDIQRIIERSNVGAKIYLDKLPISDELLEISTLYNWNIYELAASGGEDYCLLFTVNKDDIERISNMFYEQFHKPLYQIGVITENKKLLNFYHHNNVVQLKEIGYDHFKNS
jgi:thiamine-monophosphate kinase